MDNEKIYEFMTRMYGEMQQGFNRLDNRMDKLEGRFDKLEGRFDKLESKVDLLSKNLARIEIEHGQKLAVLFDAVRQNSEKLDRIEADVARHDNILKRIK